MAVGIQSCLRKQSAQHPDVPQEDLLLPKKDIREECAFLSYLLKAEFVYEYTKLTEKSGGSLMAVNFEKGCDVFVKKGYAPPPGHCLVGRGPKKKFVYPKLASNFRPL